MDYQSLLQQYDLGADPAKVAAQVARAREASTSNCNTEVYKLCFSCLDLTSLNSTDTVGRIQAFAAKAAEQRTHFPGVPDVASVCVYPNFVETVGIALGESPIAITSVAGCFPASQSFLEVKMLEVAMAAENGANEIDIVLNLGEFLAGGDNEAANEIEVLRAEIPDAVLKVIIESGALKEPALIRRASLLAMLAGADFVKTSTGKMPVAATPEAAVTMCMAIKDFYDKTGTMVGFKAAGGVATPGDTALYYTIVQQILGPDWLTPEWFRIGASSAANNLISAIEGREVKYY